MESSFQRIEEELSCSICLDLFQNAVQLPCQHIFCKQCIEQHLASNGASGLCPNCRTSFRRTDLICSRVVNNVIQTLSVCHNENHTSFLTLQIQEPAVNSESESPRPTEQVSPQNVTEVPAMSKSEYIRSKFVSLTLDEETAHPNLKITSNKSLVYYSTEVRSCHPSHRMFDTINAVLAEQVLDHGEYYWEVIVDDKKRWTLGVTRHGLNRNGAVQAFPRNGYWIIMRRTEGWFVTRIVYEAWENTKMLITVRSKPNKIGLYLNCDTGELSFYNADDPNDLEKIYTFRGVSAPVVPFFDPCYYDKGSNTHPLQICSR
ncbi:tripartite motif-containing protein 72-like [Protopterus annectens]|uniref:tripartite motif-containing protein 72-like n=1 Tax=Protopterus annectens TaxID=7888 RepID=UPI001CF990FF|nr:tripartite motif-containing protein 72-like [Protopterus annectens]XP_043942109.1 tripartite motif-containing protein 72-like [Protopterus annectens]